MCTYCNGRVLQVTMNVYMVHGASNILKDGFEWHKQITSTYTSTLSGMETKTHGELPVLIDWLLSTWTVPSRFWLSNGPRTGEKEFVQSAITSCTRANSWRNPLNRRACRFPVNWTACSARTPGTRPIARIYSDKFRTLANCHKTKRTKKTPLLNINRSSLERMNASNLLLQKFESMHANQDVSVGVHLQ